MSDPKVNRETITRSVSIPSDHPFAQDEVVISCANGNVNVKGYHDSEKQVSFQVLNPEVLKKLISNGEFGKIRSVAILDDDSLKAIAYKLGKKVEEALAPVIEAGSMIAKAVTGIGESARTLVAEAAARSVSAEVAKRAALDKALMESLKQFLQPVEIIANTNPGNDVVTRDQSGNVVFNLGNGIAITIENNPAPSRKISAGEFFVRDPIRRGLEGYVDNRSYPGVTIRVEFDNHSEARVLAEAPAYSTDKTALPVECEVNGFRKTTESGNTEVMWPANAHPEDFVPAVCVPKDNKGDQPIFEVNAASNPFATPEVARQLAVPVSYKPRDYKAVVQEYSTAVHYINNPLSNYATASFVAAASQEADPYRTAAFTAGYGALPFESVQRAALSAEIVRILLNRRDRVEASARSSGGSSHGGGQSDHSGNGGRQSRSQK